ncbi:rho GTPase-activating protein 20 [Scleropages formosus]|uniref:Rho GTPase-activating protein 20 n=1 Tax=Scleropages formosus TaxID=113540 RepID=A0A8C9RF45_SCLFO|nr:rho GTPase-activating protein 20-like [Scleropages formosus]XP_018584135.1 rho GTPase-activating protein 20-like [Scleropages formosus]XP_018584136.1 rho GTPase-activating protein 20-like [Scleropages formosus]
MTPQQKTGPSSKATSDEMRMSLLQDREKKMKSAVPRRRSASLALTKALGKSRAQSSRDSVICPSANSSSLIHAISSRGAVFIMDDHVHLTTGLQTQDRHLFLFSDTLIIAKSKSSSSLKLKQQVRLCEVWLASGVHEVAERKLNPNNSFVIGWPTTNCVVTLSSSEAKERWLSALQWHIHKLKQEEYPNKIAIKIMLLASGNTTSTTTIQVNNMDTTETVIKASAEKLGISGRPIDYRLWVISGKEEPPYPLIGHEHPFSIAMNCLRDSVEQPHLANNNILAADGTLDLEQLPKEQQVQFILKLRPSVPSHIPSDSFQKHFRRKRSLIDWALRRGNTSRCSNQSDSPTNPRKLFGHSLTSVCHNGNLPKPILDMLYLLYHEGPRTKGIFRRSANAKTCKELKERLNSGDAVEVEGESVFVAASVITDFLRNVPESVLSTELYEKWMDILDIDGHDEKTEAIKGLLDQLPEANMTLLRHLFGLLHHIQENSEENQMNAFNLALCIAPNMLWQPVPTGPEEESKSTRKVASLVQILIENTPAIFGNDTESLFTNLNNQEVTLEDAVDDFSGQLYSSDEFDSEQERLKGIQSPKRDSCFLPVNYLFMKQEKEIWSLLDEMDIFPKHQEGGMEDNTHSCEDLEDMSFHSTGSICSLMEGQGIQSSRGRCLSEPSVCQTSQLYPQSHTPVARQSSCDAAVMRDQTNQTQNVQKLRLEGTREPTVDSSPRMSSRPKYSFWRSPQIPSRFRNHGHRLTLSSRSSFSSLSSTATSPSVSSLSSLDSTFSYCSDSAFSPGDISALPFLFGTSARLHPSPLEGPTKFAKDWTPSGSMTREPTQTFSWYNEYDEQDEDNTAGIGESHDIDLEADPSQSSSLTRSDQVSCSEVDEANVDLGHADVMVHQVSQVDHTDEVTKASEPKSQSHETSIKHIQLMRPDGSSFGKEKVKRTKITFYIASNKVTVQKEQMAPVTEGKGISVRVSKAGTEPPGPIQSPSQTVQVHIPQTVFYGQTTPLVLQSVSTKQSTMPKENAKTDASADLPPTIPAESCSSTAASSKSLTRAGNTIKHTIRIRLPAAVKSTVKEYFSHTDSKGCQSDSKAVEKELLRSKLEWQSKSLTGTPKENFGKLSNGEESFV